MLGGLGARGAVPALKQALQDPFYWDSTGGLHTAPGERHYPVREAAEQALRILRSTSHQRGSARLAKVPRSSTSDAFYRRMLRIATS